MQIRFFIQNQKTGMYLSLYDIHQPKGDGNELDFQGCISL